MKQILLAVALIAVPVIGFTGFTMYNAQASATAASLGDLSPMQTIITDVQKIAATGDFAAAEKRITDFETAWDDSASAMRALDPNAWGNVDQAADGALDALRSTTPAADSVTTTLASLAASLANPTGAAGADTASVAVTLVSGIAVTDDKGRALPCEDMIKAVKAAITTAKLSDADKATVADLQTKSLERCNADDDQHADQFSAQALALMPN